jgi:hypothetical protein
MDATFQTAAGTTEFKMMRGGNELLAASEVWAGVATLSTLTQSCLKLTQKVCHWSERGYKSKLVRMTFSF